MTDEQMLKAMAEMLKPVNDRLSKIQEDIEVLKSDTVDLKDDIAELKETSQITRHSVNLLLNWAEKSDRIQNIGLFDKAE